LLPFHAFDDVGSTEDLLRSLVRDPIREILMIDLSPLKTATIYYKKAADGRIRAAYMIDGRTYSSEEEVERDILEAFTNCYESELISVEPDAPAPPGIPTWQEYKRRHLPPPGSAGGTPDKAP